MEHIRTRQFMIPKESPLYDLNREGRDHLIDYLGECTRLGVLPMFGGAGFNPDEGETVTGQVLFQRTHIDRAADLLLGLFTDAAPAETITEATIAEPTGGGYARKTLTDATWSVAGGVADYVIQTFNVTSTDYVGAINGYFIATSAASTTQRLIIVELDASGPYDLNVGDSYAITLNITIANA